MVPRNSQSTNRNPRLSIWTIVKWTLFAVTMVFVGRQAWNLWHQDEIQHASLSQIHVGWLALSSVVYAVGWIPSAWFWHRMMQVMGGDIRFRDTTRAYYCGHLGKYVPGKAMVLIIRAGMMKERGSRAWAAALSATYETLMMMGTGVAVGGALAPLLFTKAQLDKWPSWVAEIVARPWLPVVVVGVIALAAMPIVSRLLTLIAGRWTPRDMLAAGHSIHVPTRLLIEGMGTFVIAWLLQGLSLGLTLRGVTGDSGATFSLNELPVWTGAMAVSTSIGFAVLFAPGGLGVREGLLMGVLSRQPMIGAREALLATVLSRLISLVTELLVAGVLYYLVPPAVRARLDVDSQSKDSSQ